MVRYTATRDSQALVFLLQKELLQQQGWSFPEGYEEHNLAIPSRGPNMLTAQKDNRVLVACYDENGNAASTVLVSLCHLPDAAQDKSNDEAEFLLQQAADALRNLNSYRHDATTVVTRSPPERDDGVYAGVITCEYSVSSNRHSLEFAAGFRDRPDDSRNWRLFRSGPLGDDYFAPANALDYLTNLLRDVPVVLVQLPAVRSHKDLMEALIYTRESRLIEDATINGAECYGVEGLTLHGMKRRFWIGKKDLLVHRCEENLSMPGTEFHAVTDYHPVANPSFWNTMF